MKISGLYNIQIRLDSGKILVSSSGPASKISIPAGYTVQPVPEVAAMLTIGDDVVTVRTRKKPYALLVVQDDELHQVRIYSLDQKKVETFTREAMTDQDVAGFVGKGKARFAAIRDRFAGHMDDYENLALVILALGKNLSTKMAMAAGKELGKLLKPEIDELTSLGKSDSEQKPPDK